MGKILISLCGVIAGMVLFVYLVLTEPLAALAGLVILAVGAVLHDAYHCGKEVFKGKKKRDKK